MSKEKVFFSRQMAFHFMEVLLLQRNCLNLDCVYILFDIDNYDINGIRLVILCIFHAMRRLRPRSVGLFCNVLLNDKLFIASYCKPHS